MKRPSGAFFQCAVSLYNRVYPDVKGVVALLFSARMGKDDPKAVLSLRNAPLAKPGREYLRADLRAGGLAPNKKFSYFHFPSPYETARYFCTNSFGVF